MENLFYLLNKEGVKIVASSRTGTTEVYQSEDGRLFEVYHLKSGRDTITPISEIPSHLTIRYDPPKLARGLLHEHSPW